MVFLFDFIKAENKSSPTMLSHLSLGCELFAGSMRHMRLPWKPSLGLGCPSPEGPIESQTSRPQADSVSVVWMASTTRSNFPFESCLKSSIATCGLTFSRFQNEQRMDYY